MKTKFFLSVACIVTIAACNSSSDKQSKKDDTASGNDTMHHMTNPGVSIPELPAIPEGSKVYFKDLKNNATISSPFHLQMGADVIRIDTAGPVVAGSGHHHLFIDAEDSLTAGTVVPKDSTHIHFGKGQTEYDLTLSPGKHKLTLQMADGLHRSYGKKLAATISVNVK
ncbi:MAG: DUF4399 domain-containing protein [Chitinophagaceae bacterium]